MSNPRFLAADLVNAVLLDKRGLTQALVTMRAEVNADPRVWSAAQNLAYGTLRQAGRLRFFLSRLVGRPLKPADLLGHLLVGLHELDGTDTPTYAVVNETVALAARRHPGAKSFVNAVMRNFDRRREALAREAEMSPEARWNFPEWWLDRLRGEYPRHWQAIVTAQNAHPPMTLRVNRRRATTEEYLGRLRDAGLDATIVGESALRLHAPCPVDRLPGFDAGDVSVQDAGAQRTAPLLEVQDGMSVLDACAAPGGKCAHLLELSDVRMLALDVDGERVVPVRQNLERLRLRADVRAADCTRPGDWWDGRVFDRILADVPCSGSGVVRRHPDIKWLRRPGDLERFAAKQGAILDALWRLLAPGGTLLYVTCSVFPEENEAVVEAFCGRTREARLLALPDGQPPALPPGPDRDGFFHARLGRAA